MTSDDEEEQMPSDLKDLPPLEQQIVIKTRALLMMSLVCVCHVFFFLISTLLLCYNAMCYLRLK